MLVMLLLLTVAVMVSLYPNVKVPSSWVAGLFCLIVLIWTIWQMVGGDFVLRHHK